MPEYIQSFMPTLIEYGLSLLWAIVIYIIGRWAAGVISNLLNKTLTKTKVDEALVHFATSITYTSVLIFALLAAFSQLGIETTSFVAIIGASGLAIGLALQGALANFASGVMILLFKPFTVGDRVDIAGALGDVQAITIFNTIVVTPDNRTIIVPNGQITSSNITNYSTRGVIRLEMIFGIGYDDDLLKAKRILEEIVKADERIAKEPAPTVAVMELADNSVNFAVFPFVTVKDYWDVHFDLTEKIKLRFDEEGISIPYPQRDVHLYPTNGTAVKL